MPLRREDPLKRGIEYWRWPHIEWHGPAEQLVRHPLRHIPSGKEIDVKQPGEVMIRHAAFPIWRETRDGVGVPHSGDPIIHFQAEPDRGRIEGVLAWHSSA